MVVEVTEEGSVVAPRDVLSHLEASRCVAGRQEDLTAPLEVTVHKSIHNTFDLELCWHIPCVEAVWHEKADSSNLCVVFSSTRQTSSTGLQHCVLRSHGWCSWRP